MAKYRNKLPQLEGRLFVTEGGIITTLIYKRKIDLPYLATFPLLDDPKGREELLLFAREYIDVARRYGHGIILDTPTWRANPDWGAKLNYDSDKLRAVNEQSVEHLLALRDEYETAQSPMVINGAIGPRGDGYQVGYMTAAESEDYHHDQIECFARSEADLITAYTLTSVEEATGIANAAAASGIPCAISFTVETDGRLASGVSLGEAIERVDAAANGAPAYYMINCAHPTHFELGFATDAPWMKRLRGIRANPSAMSHAELDQLTELQAGDPLDFGSRYRVLLRSMPALTIVGGCCGTDGTHLAAVCEACIENSEYV